jgi:hypothetical protein
VSCAEQVALASAGSSLFITTPSPNVTEEWMDVPLLVLIKIK